MNSCLFLPLLFFFTLAETKLLSKVTPSLPRSSSYFGCIAGFSPLLASQHARALSPLEGASPIGVSCGGTCFLLSRVAICEHGVSLRPRKGTFLSPSIRGGAQVLRRGHSVPPRVLYWTQSSATLSSSTAPFPRWQFIVAKAAGIRSVSFAPWNAECLRFCTPFHLFPYFLF